MQNHFNMIGAGEWGLSVANHLSNLGSIVNVYIRDNDNLNLAKTNYLNSTRLNFYNINQLARNDINQYTNIIACSSGGFASIINDYKSYFEKYNHYAGLPRALIMIVGFYFTMSLIQSLIKP